MATVSSFVGGFFEVEIVLWRFGEGALSLFTASDVSGSEEGTNFYPKEVDGMSNFKANFARNVDGEAFGFGLKLLLDWP